LEGDGAIPVILEFHPRQQFGFVGVQLDTSNFLLFMRRGGEPE
jgi:hypothetical protein